MPATLLVADDSITIQRVIELTFADEPVRVVAAGDGQTALQKIDAEPPDIVLADVGMPRVDGYAVAAHVKHTPSLRHIPVVLLTGAFEPIDEDRARATGCDGIMVKPFEPQALVARVRELLSGQRSAALWPAELPRIEVPSPAERPARRVADATVIAPPPVAPRPVVDLPVFVLPPAAEAPVAERVAPAPRLASLPASEPLSELDTFESELDLLDEAIAKLDPTTAPRSFDAETASDFARDLHTRRADRVSTSPAATGDVIREGPVAADDATFQGWDLPTRGRGAAEMIDVKHVKPTQLPSPVPVGPPPPGEPVALPPAPTQVPVAKPSLATAFSALLAAERAQPPRRPLSGAAALSEAAVDDVVKQVLARLTDEKVQKVVLEVAERVIKEEIARITTNPPPA